jgi:pyruvate/2-oxoglutarate dehydrogenase complex dihydrolipoamide acyltransferase (E2) component
MATSAANLQLILEIAVKHSGDLDSLKQAVHAKGLLPKKLLEAPKPKKEESPFASKAAAEFAEKHSIAIKGLKGTSKAGKLTVKDLKSSQEPPEAKIAITAQARAFAIEHGVDITQFKCEGKITKAMIVDSLADDSSDDEDEILLSAAAEREMKKYGITEEDLIEADIEGTGVDGRVKLGDIKELIDEAKKATE